MEGKKEHPIRVVSQRTGLNPHTIRMWEKRYQAVVPERTDSNRRLYSDSDIRRLDLLLQALQTGRSIGQIAHLSDDRLLEYIRTDLRKPFSAGSEARAGDNEYRLFVQVMLRAVEETRPEDLEALLARAHISFGVGNMVEHIISPFLRSMGDLWQRGSLRVFQEHTATAVVRTFLGELLRSIRVAENSAVAVVSTPAGQRHEFGALMCAVTAACQGWKVFYSGPGVPAEEIAGLAAARNAKVVALSIVYPPADNHLRAELDRLGRLIPAGVTTVCGGRAAGSYRDTIGRQGFLLLHDYREFREKLPELIV